MIAILLVATLAGCTAPNGAPTGAPTPETSATPTPSPACAGSASAARVEFVTPYIEQERPFHGGIAATWLAKEHAFRSWTDMRMIGHRDMASTGQPGFEVVTIDATNGSTTWLFTLRYELVSRCVEDRAADDAQACEHWGSAANQTRAGFEAAGGWTSFAGGDCRTGGGA